jgi:stearoyl-CoA desaturase (delta-9 desaturase)
MNQIRWVSVVYFSILHMLGVWSLLVSSKTQWSSWGWSFLWFQLSCLGVTAGAHRLWAHKSYLATRPLRIFLILIQSSAIQMSVLSWCRIHRLHHRHTDTDLDPHNIHRGFWFSHMGWLLVKPTPEVQEALRQVNLQDLEADKLLVQQRHYFLPYAIVCGILAPWCCAVMWGETWWYAFLVVVVFRLIAVYHVTWCINSVAHTFGTQPYSTTTEARQNALLSLLSGGEGWHNYHHTYPGDYRTNEGMFLNLARLFIDGAVYFRFAKRYKKVQ